MSPNAGGGVSANEYSCTLEPKPMTDPDLFFSALQDAKKNIFFLLIKGTILYAHLHQSSKVPVGNKSLRIHEKAEIKVL